MKLTNKQIKQIEDIINNILTSNNFPAGKIEKTFVTENGYKFQTPEFNQIPAIFKSLDINGFFNNDITETKLALYLDIDYFTFDNRQNGIQFCSIFFEKIDNNFILKSCK